MNDQGDLYQHLRHQVAGDTGVPRDSGITRSRIRV